MSPIRLALAGIAVVDAKVARLVRGGHGRKQCPFIRLRCRRHGAARALAVIARGRLLRGRRLMPFFSNHITLPVSSKLPLQSTRPAERPRYNVYTVHYYKTVPHVVSPSGTSEPTAIAALLPRRPKSVPRGGYCSRVKGALATAAKSNPNPNEILILILIHIHIHILILILTIAEP